ncbi:MAG: hypothetical protein K8T10_20540 [Candidatus Eremiobacteraeota bacterium]|nr:hypothetical protein [Candidatus Eremiobacteraeota bacterium]
MYIFLGSIIDNIAARLTGPINFRFIVQPLVAIALGVRDGIMDAREGTPPFLFDLVSKPQNRKRQLKSTLKSILNSVIISIVIDGIAQYLIFKHVRPVPAIIVGTFVIAVPYALARGITNRIISLKKKKVVEKE